MDAQSILGLLGVMVVALIIGLATGSFTTEVVLALDGPYAIATVVTFGLVLVFIGGLSFLGRLGNGPTTTPYW
ncbi:MAG: hypothetical protein U5K37_07300 [Natrialbaceae archaeon]|nr:hypothetical protein [Natrialbaceae archaeon]